MLRTQSIMKNSHLLLGFLVSTIFIGCDMQSSTDPNYDATPAKQVSSDWQETPSESSPRPTQSTRTDEHLTEIVQEDVQRISRAVYQADVATALEFTHPKIIDMLGGMASARSELKTAFSKIQLANMKLQSMSFPEAPTFLETDVHYFVIVPTLSIISAHGQKIESLNFQFGIQVKGTSTWKYIEGSRVNQQNVTTLFPDFPNDFKFPKFYRKKL